MAVSCSAVRMSWAVRRLTKQQAFDWNKGDSPGYDTFGVIEDGQIVGAYNTKIDHPMNHTSPKHRIEVASLPRMTYIGDVEVLPEFREKGIAGALMKHALKRFNSEAFIVGQKGSVAYNMYKRLGFKDVAPGVFSNENRVMIK